MARTRCGACQGDGWFEGAFGCFDCSTCKGTGLAPAAAPAATAEPPAASPARGEPRTHELKTWPEPYAAIESGCKTFEIRVNDRGFRVGDVLWLQEYDRTRSDVEAERYTGRFLTREVTYMVPGGKWDLPDHLCVMSIAPRASPPVGAPAVPVEELERLAASYEKCAAADDADSERWHYGAEPYIRARVRADMLRRCSGDLRALSRSRGAR